MALSDTTIRFAKSAGKPYTLGDTLGLSLAVAANGSKSWHFRYYWLGKQQRMSFGTYPELSLRDARALRDEARALVASGVNPHVERKRRRFAAKAAHENSFQAVFEKWHAHRGLSLAKGRQTALSQVERIFAKDVLPLLGRRSIYDIKRHDLLDVLARVERRNATSMAEKIRGWFNQMYRFALVKVPGLEHNPASDLDVVAMPAPPVRNNPFLRMEDLPVFLKGLRNYHGRLQTQLGLRLLLLTGVRTGELRQAVPGQFHLDQGLWIIPIENVKQLQLELRKRGKRVQDIPPYVVPLSVQAVEVVRHLLDQKRPDQHYLLRHDYRLDMRISENTLNFALKRMGYADRLTGHGMRATMSTALNEIGYPKIWIESQLSHADPNPISASYNHAEYVEPRRRMMQDWADRLDLFEQGEAERASAHLPVSLDGFAPGIEAVPTVIAPAPTIGAMMTHAIGSMMAPAQTMPASGQASPSSGTDAASAVAGRLPAVRLPVTRLQPAISEAQRLHVERLAIFKGQHALPAAVFAQAVGKSRRAISYDIQNRKLLALSIGNLGQRVPDWHLDPVKHRLIQAVLKFSPDADVWTVYEALSASHRMLGGRSPVEAVTAANLHEAVMAACFVLKEAQHNELQSSA